MLFYTIFSLISTVEGSECACVRKGGEGVYIGVCALGSLGLDTTLKLHFRTTGLLYCFPQFRVITVRLIQSLVLFACLEKAGHHHHHYNPLL
jgi:hypothetical protein